MNVLKQALIIVLATGFSFLLAGPVSAQSVAMSSAAPAILPLNAGNIDIDEVALSARELESYGAGYPGGAEQLETFLRSNVVYPELAKENNFEGTTIVRFKVLEDGSLSEYSVQQSTHEICDQEVIAALRDMKKWVPAKIRGKNVATWCSVAVNFKMTF
ncbi:energy transducer TonB [Neolewinella aurantiaca]|uniref:Energy transducer TonB n=1 Tax=Neolewinella aurantiaca TaxID=2602767 RepID=A0A5C7FGD4_9BACT|nr:energy transducer TonB [Neolewinella aurantiaca]TXF90007.1 energy transducer TonB [Neolewinella aurantiaca]